MMNRSVLVLLAVMPLVYGGLVLPPPDFSNGCAAVTCPNFEVDPQCCNGQSFPNSCLAQCTNFGDLSSCVPGSCPGDGFVCTAEFDPVCCDGREFSNLCNARLELGDAADDTCEKGSCDNNGGGIDCSIVRCSPDPTDPICCDGVTQPNGCFAQCVAGVDDISQCTPGECPDIIVDPPIDCSVILCAAGFTDPVCCGDTTYGNPCLAQCSGGVQDVDEECFKGFCPGDDIACTEEFDPVCCGDQEFSNLCKARKDLGDVVDDICVKGKCEDQIACIALYDPVCCFGDELFGNDCEAGIVYGDLPNFGEVCVKGECQTDGNPDLPSCPNDNVANCFLDPCQFASCPSDPDAVCLSNYCLEPFEFLGTTISGEGCDAVWVNYQKNAVVSDQECRGGNGGGGGSNQGSDLPECDNAAQCFIDPCRFSSCSVDGAVCLSNYCVEDIEYLGTTIKGPCTAVWVNADKSEVLSKKQCIGFSIFDNFGGFGDFFP